jgi:hypothetical protein
MNIRGHCLGGGSFFCNPHALFILLSILYGVVTGVLVFHHVSTFSVNDYYAHATRVYDVWLTDGFGAFSQYISYPGWHFVQFLLAELGFSIRASTVITAGFFNMATALLVFYCFRQAIGKEHVLLAIVAGCAALMVTAVYVPWFSPHVYYGQSSPNIWHNPTYLAVRPAALASMALFVRLYNTRSRTGFKWFCEGGLLSVLLVISLLLKPSFFQVFLPAAIVFLLIDCCIWQRDLKFLAKMSAIFALPILVVALQFFSSFYSAGDSSSGIVIMPFAVWSVYTPNVGISLLLLLAFPLYSLFVLRKDVFAKGSVYLLPALMILAGLLQYILLAELGARMFDGNFGWGYATATFIAWCFFLPLFVRKALVEKSISGVKTVLGSVIVALHTASGIYYYIVLTTSTTVGF